MNNYLNLNHINEIDIQKPVALLRAACRGSQNEDIAIYAAAYVLMRSLDDYRVSIDSMEYYFESSGDTSTRQAVVSTHLAAIWARIRELKYQFDADTMKAVLLNYESSSVKNGLAATPRGISRLAVKILNPSPKEHVGELCSGIGGFARELLETHPDIKYTGIELASELCEIAKIRCELLGIDSTIEIADVFDPAQQDRRFDMVFCNSPLGLRPIEAGIFGQRFTEEFRANVSDTRKAGTMDWAFCERARQFVAGPGKCICIVASGSTWNTQEKAIREMLLSIGAVEAVIALPERLLEYTNVQTSMVVLSHGNNATMMVDARDLCEKGRRGNTLRDQDIERIFDALTHESEISRFVSYDDVKDKDFSLAPAMYLEKPVEEISNGVELGTLGSISRGAQITASVLDALATDQPTETQYLMTSNIQDGMLDRDLPYLTELEPRYQRYCIKDGSLIISKIGTPSFKIAVAEVPKGRSILANGNLYVMNVDTSRVNPYFIKAFLESEQGSTALQRCLVGTTIPSLPVDGLKKLRVPLPPLDEQNKVAEQYRQVQAEVARLREQLMEATAKLKTVFDNSRD